jgi:ribosomal protein S1
MYKNAARFSQHRASAGHSSAKAGNVKSGTRQKNGQKKVPKSIIKALRKSTTLNGRITHKNAGGFIVLINEFHAFCPFSEMYPNPVTPTELEKLKKNHNPYLVIKVESHSVIVSRRKAVEQLVWSVIQSAFKKNQSYLV